MSNIRSINTISLFSWNTASQLGKVGIGSALGCLPVGILHGITNSSSLFVVATGIGVGLCAGKYVVSRMEKNGSRTEMVARDVAMRYARPIGISSGVLTMLFVQAMTQQLL